MSEVIVFTSGKGGVGKTTLTANVGTELAKQGYRCVMLDMDIGLRNLDVIMGVEDKIQYHMIDIVEKRCRVKQTLVKDKTYNNLFIIPSSQRNSMYTLTKEIMYEIISELKKDFDYILLDCPAGIGQGFSNAVQYADRCIVVTTMDIAALRDAHKVLRILTHEQKRNIEVIVNKVEPELIYSGDIISVDDVKEILDCRILGIIPSSKSVVLSYNNGEHLNIYKSVAAKSVERIAERITGSNLDMIPLKDMRSFFSRMNYKYSKV